MLGISWHRVERFSIIPQVWSKKSKPNKRKLINAGDEPKFHLKSEINSKMAARQFRKECGFEFVSNDAIKRS